MPLGLSNYEPDSSDVLFLYLSNHNCMVKPNNKLSAWQLAGLRNWWHAKSQTFTALCGSEGEEYTHGDVVKSHLCVLLFVIILGVAGWLEGGAL